MDIRSLFHRFIISLIFTLSPIITFANPQPSLGATYLQVIQIVNFLSNTSIADPGMTPTSVVVQFYDSATSKVCWTTSLAYLGDFTLHSGPGQNCTGLINQIKVTPNNVATLLQTYTGPYTINVDTTKYSSQITVTQATAPVFDTASGLVATPGTINADIQEQFREDKRG